MHTRPFAHASLAPKVGPKMAFGLAQEPRTKAPISPVNSGSYVFETVASAYRVSFDSYVASVVWKNRQTQQSGVPQTFGHRFCSRRIYQSDGCLDQTATGGTLCWFPTVSFGFLAVSLRFPWVSLGFLRSSLGFVWFPCVSFTRSPSQVPFYSFFFGGRFP